MFPKLLIVTKLFKPLIEVTRTKTLHEKEAPRSPLAYFAFHSLLQFTMVETIATAVQDVFPGTRSHKHLVVVGLCSIGFLLGLSMCFDGGFYMFVLFDNYSATWSLMILSILEVLLIAYVYGYDKFKENLAEMMGPNHWFFNYYWSITWRIISPIALTVVLFFTWIQYAPVKVGDYLFPSEIEGLGWCMAFISILLVPIFSVYQIYKAKKESKPLVSLWQVQDSFYDHARESSSIEFSRDAAVKKLEESYDNPAFDGGALSQSKLAHSYGSVSEDAVTRK
ncbi:unnamed protein product [Darwinula stevensoni]|uniref:Sodium-dependent nutrient amino acid transporter 1 n=1 Tax=Darwinula stevensoni TaxID=69355 RepID=A0A7R9AGL7_9CRUS|nr:unnamed protein product [Darwinula stevensoni]CAG0904475.1 unnamed protein product [Darwinula stevensoni]